MSVINKMLRDLDQRQATESPQPAGSETGWPEGTVPLAGTATVPAGARKSKGALWGASAGLGLMALVGAWWMQQPVTPVDVAVSTPVSAPTAAAPAQSASPAAPSSAPPSPVVTTAADSEAVQLRMESQLSAARALDALLTTPPPPPLSSKPATPAAVAPVAKAPVAVPAPPKEVSSAPPRPVASPRNPPAAVASVGASAAVNSVVPAQRSALAGNEALAQAQQLWGSGSADAAIDVLGQAMAVAERNVKSGGEAVGNPLLLTVVREWTRMQLASGRYGVVWEALTRLEPVVGNVADLLALRANAAQRIGRHQDSVHAYMAALQLRPDEQRWMLGAAVSLAALGQNQSAAEMADKARSLGPINKSIAAYLRQLGVNLQE